MGPKDWAQITGRKHSQMAFRVSQEDDCLKKEFQDLVILA